MPAHRSLPFLLLLVLAMTAGMPLHAQFETQILLNKTHFLVGEPVEATVTVINRSGADVVMGGPNGQSWLRFDVTAPDGSPVSMVQSRMDETFVFKAGATARRRAMVTDTHAFTEYGNYQVAASVYHPLTQQFYQSNRIRAAFSDSKAFWEKPFGVPMGLPQAGQVRRYDLVLLRDTSHTNLYVRLVDQNTNLRLVTHSLGHCIMVATPQVSLDAQNNLHVLFMTAPHLYVHVTMDPVGKARVVSYYKEAGTNRPQLAVQSDQQSIAVTGGTVFDPNAPDPSAPRARSVAERPPGL